MASNLTQGAIDVDIHPPQPTIAALVRHLDDYWADQVRSRNIDRAPFAGPAKAGPTPKAPALEHSGRQTCPGGNWRGGPTSRRTFPL